MTDVRRRVLVVEDEWLIRAEMANSLADAGYDVLEASNGMEAVNLLHDPGEVDILVTDISMPIMDGIAVAEHVLEKHPHVPIVFASARANATTLPQPSFTLPKPYCGDQLVRVVEAALA